MDCFAALAMTERHGLLRGACHRERIRATRWLAMTERFLRHCEERSDEAIHSFLWHGLLRCARNDGEAWIASRSLSSGAHSRDPLARNDGKRPFFVIARSAATKQSSLPLCGAVLDCFAALAMTERRGLLHGARRRAFA